MLATDRPDDPANTLIEPPVLNTSSVSACSEIDEPRIDMVLAAENVTRLREYKPRYDDDFSDNVIEDDRVMPSELFSTTFEDVIDKVKADDIDVILKLYR